MDARRRTNDGVLPSHMRRRTNDGVLPSHMRRGSDVIRTYQLQQGANDKPVILVTNPREGVAQDQATTRDEVVGNHIVD